MKLKISRAVIEKLVAIFAVPVYLIGCDNQSDRPNEELHPSCDKCSAVYQFRMDSW